MASWFLKFASYKTKDDIFNLVKLDKKTIETRPFNPNKKRNYSQIVPGDTLVCYSLDSQEKIEKTATFVRVYKSVEDMLEQEPIGQIFPGVDNSDNLLKIYGELKIKWGKSYARKLEKYGIVAIGFR